MKPNVRSIVTAKASFVDVVNFNADASCLESSRWLDSLRGGYQSRFLQWLKAYVEFEKPVSLGFCGGVVSDIRALNPEAVELINRHPEIFEILWRPYAHDLAPLRTDAGFLLNVTLGRRVMVETFRNVSTWYLAPEFMLTGAQVDVLDQLGCAGTFSFSECLSGSGVEAPHFVVGDRGSKLLCVSAQAVLTKAHLSALHGFSAEPWNCAMRNASGGVVVGWRDGESAFFTPQGLARERVWLAGESRWIVRGHLRDHQARWMEDARAQADDRRYCSRPTDRWMAGRRTDAYVERVGVIEARIKELCHERIAVWLHAIGSDVLSSVAKDAPEICIRIARDGVARRVVLPRVGRYQEAIDILRRFDVRTASVVGSKRPHLVKLEGRVQHLKDVLATPGGSVRMNGGSRRLREPAVAESLTGTF